MTTDDRRLQSTLERVGVNTIPGIEEANIYKDDIVIQFQNPKVQASPRALASQMTTSPSVEVKTCAAPVWCKSSSSPGGAPTRMVRYRVPSWHNLGCTTTIG